MLEMLCRICEGLDDLKFIFENADNLIAYKLMTCADVQVRLNDNLPQQICSCCLSQLEISYNFKLQCEKAEAKFHDINNSKKEKIKLNGDVLDEDENTKCDVINVEDGVKVGVEYGVEKTFTSVFINKLKSSSKLSIVKNISNEVIIDSNNCTLTNDNVNEKPLNSQIPGLSKKQYQCFGCDKVFDKSVEYSSHKRIHGPSIFCPVCNKGFKSNTQVVKHQKTHLEIENIEMLECELCFRKYTSKGNLERHIRSHTDDKRHVCDVCGKRFVQSSTLKDHAVTHQENRNYACKDCDKSFKTNRYLLKHRENVHKDLGESKSVICNICGGRFVDQRKLKWHMKTHKLPKGTDASDKLINNVNAVCNYCGKTFKQSGQLNIHIRVHTGEKPYECSICKKKFSFKSSFNYHMNCHTGTRPYNCTVCNKRFTQPTHLKHHLVTHSGEKAHACSFCNKIFALKSNLRIHVRIHTGERPYVCSICNRGFIDSNGLKKHIKKHAMTDIID